MYRPSITLCSLALALVACNNTPAPTDTGGGGNDAGPASCAAPGMPTAGPADDHCGGATQATDPASCFPDTTDAGPPEDTGVPEVDAGVPPCEYGETVFGHEADDDDCKYHVSWTSTPICEGSAGVFFTVVATSTVDGSPATGADIRAETFVTSGAACDVATGHPGPNTFAHLAEGPPGTYSGAIQFDQAGQWTVRFHLYDECSDEPEDSPHGHVGFRLTVP